MRQLIDDIYEAALAPARWTGVLTAFEQRFDAIGAVLFSHTEKGTRWIAGEGGGAPMRAFVEQGWMAGDPRLAALLARQHAGFVLDTELFSPEEMAAMPVYREFLHPAGILVSAGTHIADALQENLVLSVAGFREPGRATAAIGELDALRPHLARAARVAARLQLTQARSAVATLQALGVPGAVVGRRGAVKAANVLFEAEIGPDLIDGPCGMRLTDEGADGRLRDALTHLRDGRGGASIVIRGDSAAEARVLHVLPVMGEANDLFFGAWALLVLTGRRHAPALAPGLLEELYNLSPAEARVAGAVTEGTSLEEISRRTGRSIQTVRNQFKAALTKTGTARQGELVAMLSGLNLPSG
jgi:DNA-binding CsgD family transcriptional regulator